MGLLSQGTPLAWKDAQLHADYVREQGIKQLLSIFHRLKHRVHDELLWGDEVEGVVVRLDSQARTAKLKLCAKQVLETLGLVPDDHVLFHPEYAEFMIETTPGLPFSSKIAGMLGIEANMRLRRERIAAHLPPGVIYTTLTNFPRLGCPDFTDPGFTPNPEGPVSQSLFFPDQAINPHPRFATLTANIRCRRQGKVAINVPIFRDKHTLTPFIEDFGYHGPGEGAKAALPDHIYMDAMGFGMGCCCLQVTFQACNIQEARLLYDQLAVVAPLVLALSAASPVFRGLLSDVDCRWDVISGSVDDRTPQERSEQPLTTDRRRVPKSRYGSMDAYISNDPLFKPEYNDVELVIDEDICRTLQANGMDEQLARHFAHLFIRDPLVIFSELLKQDPEQSSDHFENIQSTNWQTMRFKPPPPGSPIGWRVEFRPTEVQITDFENAAFTIFIVLLSRTILSFNLNLYIPISQNEANMAAAQQRGAVLHEAFWFRQNISGARDLGENSPFDRPAAGASAAALDADEVFAQMSLNTIVNGQPGVFPGLIPMIEFYLNTMNVDLQSRCTISRYLSLIGQRASGELMTTAAFIRDFIQHHPDYKHDSVVSDAINHDLIRLCDDLAVGRAHSDKLLPRPCVP